jgi:hypothetical protein
MALYSLGGATYLWDPCQSAFTKAATWQENLHPRDHQGRFAEKESPSVGKGIQEVIDIIRGEEYEYYGIRWIHDSDPVSVGDSLPNSYRWEDGESTGEELNGTSAIECTADDAERGLIQIKDSYASKGDQIVLIGGNSREWGEDDGEILIKDAVVLAVVDG